MGIKDGLKNRICSMFLASAMLLSTTAGLGIVAAADEEPLTKKIPLTIEYLGSDDRPKNTEQSLPPSAGSNKVWIGVGVESNKDTSLKLSELGLFTGGMHSLEVSFAYDSTYIKPLSTSSDMDNGWKSALGTGNLGSIGGSETVVASAWWDSNLYDIDAVAETEIFTDSQTKNLGIDNTEGNWKMCSMNIMLKPGVDIKDARFYGFDDDDEKQYLIKLPFSLVSTPEYDSTMVLKMILGPETFNIGSGSISADGIDTLDEDNYSGVWEEKGSDDPTDYSNLKNVFDFKGDIYLFSDGATKITNIETKPIKYGEGEGGTKTETPGDPLPMYYSEAVSGENGFKETVKSYYLSVENEVDKVQISVQAIESITINDTAATEASSGIYTLDVPLKELDPKTVDQDNGFTNVITVKSASGETYTLYIRRLMKPKVVFEPGNSPFGLIERMSDKREYVENQDDRWNEDKIAAAKKAFVTEQAKDGKPHGNYMYGNGLVPDNAQTTYPYTVNAWGFEVNPNDDSKNDWDAINSPEINFDVNEDALFVYQSDRFREPGFVAYNEMGKEVALENIKMTLTVKLLADITAPAYADDEIIGIEEIVADEEGWFDLVQLVIRPEIYHIVYTYVNEDGGETKIGSRPVAIVSKRGDVELTMDPAIQYSDFTKFKNLWSKYAGNKKAALFIFRAGDLEQESSLDAAIQYSDVTILKNQWSKLGNPDAIQYYNSSILTTSTLE